MTTTNVIHHKRFVNGKYIDVKRHERGLYKKVKVEFKTPINKKTETMEMTAEAIKFYRKNSNSSPFKKISILK